MTVLQMPEWLPPMAATLTQDRFTSPDWIFERKLDGIRLLAFKNGQNVNLFSRNRLPQHLPDIARAVSRIPVHDVILDGELTWGSGAGYYVFDIMWLDGRDVRELPLVERRSLLDRLPIRRPLARVVMLDTARPWELACSEGWEGVIAKRCDSPYEHRRSPLWLKMKCEVTEELIVGGFTEPRGARVGLGALLVGYHDGGDFVYAGKVGTGFDARLLRALRERLDATEIAAAPFTRATGLPRAGAHWVKPEIVVEVAFIEWTVHRKLRHPRLLSVCWERSAPKVVRRPR